MNTYTQRNQYGIARWLCPCRHGDVLNDPQTRGAGLPGFERDVFSVGTKKNHVLGIVQETATTAGTGPEPGHVVFVWWGGVALVMGQ